MGDFAAKQGLSANEEELIDPPQFTVREWEDYREVGPPLPVISERDLFGSRACAHLDSSWELVEDEAVLRCRSCFNPAVARIPAHRLPDGHPLRDRVDLENYAVTRRFWNAVRGREPERLASFGGMAARDGAASMDPADYATEEKDPAAQARTDRARFLAGMNRR